MIISSACGDCRVWVCAGLVMLGVSFSAGGAEVGTTAGQFEVTAAGAASYAIPISVPPGIAGIAPKLSIQYSSQGGNGPLGVGFSLGGLSAITRCPTTLDQDGFINQSCLTPLISIDFTLIS